MYLRKRCFIISDDVLLTTIDNPYNPFTNYDEWLAYDLQMGYNTNSLLDRVANVSDELSDEDYDSIVLEAMKEIVKYNVSGVHRLITENEVLDPNKIKTNLAFALNEQLKNNKKVSL